MCQLHWSLEPFVFLQLHTFWRQMYSQNWLCCFVCMWSCLVHLILKSFFVRFTAHMMLLSISCFSLGRITKWGYKFKASKVGELNRGLINTLRKVIFNLMPSWTNSNIMISNYPPAIKRQVKSKLYPCIQVLCLNTLRNDTHKSKSLGHFPPSLSSVFIVIGE